MSKLTQAVMLLLIATGAAHADGLLVGSPSPNLIGWTLADKNYRLYSDKAMPKVINFFWVECVPCREELPELAQLEKQYPGIKFIAVHAKNETPEKVAAFVKTLPGIPSTLIMSSDAVQETFQITAFPYTVVLDKGNIVRLNLHAYTQKNMQSLRDMLQAMSSR